MSKNMIEQWRNRWNSFNPAKALAHVEYWKPLKFGVVPPPIAVSVDPCGFCNLRCHHCNAAEILKTKKVGMSEETADQIIERLMAWKTRSVCIGGGGESLANPNTSYLINNLYLNGIETALITNGVFLDKFIYSLGMLSYLGVSVDAANSPTWDKVKGMQRSYGGFGRVISNMLDVRKRYPKLDLTYKYLVLPSNYKQVYHAVGLAKDIGCTNFHLRPGGAPWFEKKKSYGYTHAMRESVGRQLDSARVEFEDEKFHIYGVVSKFAGNWSVNNTFSKCWASLITCFISPDGTVGLCCDRRGDKSIELCHINKAGTMWGGKKHMAIMEGINIPKCPRCTFGHLSEIVENAVVSDKMFYNIL